MDVGLVESLRRQKVKFFWFKIQKNRVSCNSCFLSILAKWGGVLRKPIATGGSGSSYELIKIWKGSKNQWWSNLGPNVVYCFLNIYSGIQVFRYSGTRVFRYSGIHFFLRFFKVPSDRLFKVILILMRIPSSLEVRNQCWWHWLPW